MSVIPYADREKAPLEKREAVRRMFDSIAGRYDLMNDIMTAGFHRRWKTLAAREVCQGGANCVLDVACGTGDIGFAVEKFGVKEIFSVDLSFGMLKEAKNRAERRNLSERLSFSRTDALKLPFRDDTFDSVITGFSLRNVDGIAEMFGEVHRVLKKGGKFASLEISPVRGSLFSRMFDIYFKKIVPFVGGIVTGDQKAYDYLPESVANVPDADRVAKMMQEAGFTTVLVKRMGMGTVALVSGKKLLTSSQILSFNQ